MKVLFVYAESEKGGFKPMSISILSSILAREGHERRLFDTSIYDIPIKGRVDDINTAEELLIFPPTKMPAAAKKRIDKDVIKAFNETLSEYKPDLVAFSTTSLMYVIVESLVRGMNCGKHPPLAIGGIHTLSCTKEVVDSGLFDYVCFSEGENAISAIMDHIDEKTHASDIPNVVVKNNGKYMRNKLFPFSSNLDELPFYDWSIFEDYHFWRPYQGRAYRMGDYQSSRGCPNKCLFCFYNTFYKVHKNVKRIRFFSAERCISEMEELTKRYNLNFWKFHDSDFLLRSEDKFGELIELYASRIRLPFVCNTSAKTTTKEKVKLLKTANCKSVSIGVESGSEKIRSNVLNKPVSNERIIESVSIFKEAGIRIVTSNMLGLPDETEENIRETIELNRKAAPDLAEPTFFYPFKGTELGDLCYERNYVKDHSDQLINLRNNYVMKMPYIKPETLSGLFRTFPLYLNLPSWLDPIIKLAEKNNDTGNKVYKELHEIVQKKIDKQLKQKGM